LLIFNCKQITHTYTGGHGSTIVFILPFGEHLISIDEDGRMCMRDIKSEGMILSQTRCLLKRDGKFELIGLLNFFSRANFLGKV